MVTKKALVKTVSIGHIEFEGLMLPDGNFGISLQQLRFLAFPSVLPKSASKHLKGVCGKEFQFFRCATELNNRPQLIIDLNQLNFCLTELAFKGHSEARDLVRVLAGLSLYQLFCDAFEERFEKEDRQQWLKARQEGKETRKTLTEAIKLYIELHPEVSDNYRKWRYNHCSEKVLNIVFGRSAKQLRKDWSVNEVRSAMTAKELKLIEQVEALSIRLIEQQDLEPLAAVEEAGARSAILTVGR
jgi:hypothetical protein